MEMKRTHSCHKFSVGTQKKEGEWVCLGFFSWFKSMGNLACHRKKEAIKAAFSSEVARNTTSQYFCFSTSVAAFQVGFLGEITLICYLILMLPWYLRCWVSQALIPNWRGWSCALSRASESPNLFPLSFPLPPGAARAGSRRTRTSWVPSCRGVTVYFELLVGKVRVICSLCRNSLGSF